MRRLREIFNRLRLRAFAPIDIASIVFFRFVFGGLLVRHVWEYLTDGKVATYWLEPPFLFKYYGFSWVHPWPGHGLYIHWVALGALAFLVAIGLCYRISAVLLWLSCTYFFLLDEARYVNHTYLICLFSFLLALIPAHRAFSVDAWLRPALRAQIVPAWNLWLLRLQMGVVYFYGGVAKVAPDWLRGEPMRFRLREAVDFPAVGRFFREEWAVYGVSYGSLLLDLLVVPLLLWRRTRVVAFCCALLFNFLNMHFFDIGIFPWLAIAATTLFFSPSWPRRALALVGWRRGSYPSDFRAAEPGWKEAVVLGFVIIYVVIQILVPLRHFLTPGGMEWTFAEHRFSWRMLLQEGGVRSFFYVTDPNTEETTQVGPSEFLNERQRSVMAYSPDICVQFAQYLARVMPRRGPRPLRVEARILRTINGRKLHLYVDPNVDLAAESRPLLRPHWVREIRDPLPPLEERYRNESFPDGHKD